MFPEPRIIGEDPGMLGLEEQKEIKMATWVLVVVT